MKRKLSTKDIQGLLEDLKNAEKEHPPDMIQSRRNVYIKQASAMTVLIKVKEGGSKKKNKK